MLRHGKFFQHAIHENEPLHEKHDFHLLNRSHAQTMPQIGDSLRLKQYTKYIQSLSFKEACTDFLLFYSSLFSSSKKIKILQ